MPAQELIIDLQRKQLVGDLRGAEWRMPQPFHSEVLGLRCRFLNYNPQGDAYFNLGNFTLQNISGSALTIAVLKASDLSLLASQTSWAYDAANNVITGLLDLYTVGMIAAIGAASSLACKFLVKLVTAADGTYVLMNDLTVQRDPVSAGIGAPVPSSSYYTAAEMDARYLKKVEDAGIVWTSKSPTTGRQTIWGTNEDGSAKTDAV